MKHKIIPWLALTLAACTTAYPPRDTSTQDRISQEMKQAAAAKPKPASAVPEAVSSSLLPPLRTAVPKASGKQLEQRFDLVVNEAPINQVLMGLVAGTRYSILIKPKTVPPSSPTPGAASAQAAALAGMTDKVTVNLKDVTVFEALEALRELYGYDFTVDGNRIFVQPPELQTRFYQVNYVLGQRRGVSDIQVIGGASVGSSSSSTSGTTGTSGSGSTTTSSYASVQASAMSTLAKADLWGEVEDALRTVLGCQIPRNQQARATGTGGATTTSSTSSTSTTGTASRADVSFQGDTPVGERTRGVDGCTDGRAMNVNQMSGTILVRGMPNELRVIEKMLRSMQLNIERQVIIEAKIIDVELNAESQQGINWGGFRRGMHRFSVGADSSLIGAATPSGDSGDIAAGTSLGGLLGTALIGAATGSAFPTGMGMAFQGRNFFALINFLETQGRVHVLSSPRIATLNNQKAVIKVGSEEPFVTNIQGGSVTFVGNNQVNTPPTLQYQPFFSGISLDVTPQIDASDNITLHVHSMVNSVIEKQKVSLPVAGAAQVPFAVNTINETDSVVKTRDGQIVVIGGLMTESTSDSRSKVPGIGEPPGLGALFRKGGQSASKRELVILLKTTVVKDDSAWSGDIAATQGRIEGLNTGAPQP